MIIAIAFVVLLGSFSIPNGTAHAINPAAFDPGRIIDDAIFYDPAGMGSIAEVQSFLNAHVPACDTNGTQPSGYGNLNNAQYAQQVMGWPGPPYVCLNNYYENPSTGQTSFEMGGGAFPGGISAAQIIYDAAQQNGINPKVLLVMIRKESLNLFSDSWPMKSQYRYAMGYACPDSGPNYSAACVESKAGFYNQVNYAAWQLRYYYNNMGSYNYAPGRWNTIQYSTDPSCGTKSVYIQNYATASLYIYTPYTPNDASLNAYPGTAPCGSYGNRNFWFYWQEWFGSTLTNGNFVRTVDNATVYLIGDKTKYPIADSSLIAGASALGGVGLVSQAYLDTMPTGPLLGRIIQSPDGTIYFYDSNIKLPFSSCTIVADYGGACGSIPILSQPEIDKFVTGPLATNGMKTTSGKTFYITGGKKKEVLDNQSLANAGLSSTGFNILTDNAFNYLPYAAPYVRDNVAIRDRQNSNINAVASSGTTYSFSGDVASTQTLSSLSSAQLDDQSITALSPTSVGSLIKDESNNTYLLTKDGKKQIPDPTSFQASAVQIPATTIGQLNGSGALSNPSLMKSYSDSTVYVVVGGQKRPLISMDDLKSITGQSSPYIAWTSDAFVNSIPTGNIIVGAGRLVKTATNSTVYMSDGYNSLIPMSTFNPAQDMGASMVVRTISDAILAQYTVGTSVLSAYVSCGGSTYVAMSGNLYPMTLSGKTPSTLQPQTCNVLSTNSTVPGFIHVPNGTIYKLTSGTVYPISSWSTYQSLKANGGSTVDSTAQTVGLFPQGSPL